MELNSEEIII